MSLERKAEAHEYAVERAISGREIRIIDLARDLLIETVKVTGFPSIPGETGNPGEGVTRGCVRLAKAFFDELDNATPWPKAEKVED